MKIWFFLKYLIDSFCLYSANSSAGYTHSSLLWSWPLCDLPALSGGLAWQVVLPTVIGSSSVGHEQSNLEKAFSPWLWLNFEECSFKTPRLKICTWRPPKEGPKLSSSPTAHISFPSCSKALHASRKKESRAVSRYPKEKDQKGRIRKAWAQNNGLHEYLA